MNKRKNTFIKSISFATIIIYACGCLKASNNFKPEENKNQFNINKIKVQNERIEHPAYIDLDCFDVDCACESETCKIDNKDDETITTEEGYKFNPFSIDVLEFLNQNADVYQDNIKMETATTPAQTENDNLENDSKQQQLEQDKQNDSNDNVSLDNKKIDLSALHEMLKIKENKANITEINERIKITPKFVIITKTKSKVMMNLSVSF